MRIILLLSSLYTGGAEFSTLTFYGWLRKQGFEIKLVCYKKASPAYEPEKFGLNDVVILEERKFFQKLSVLNQIVDKFKPALIHSVLFEANILGRFCKFNNRKTVHLESLVNEMYAEHRLHDPRVNRFKLKAYQLFDFATQLLGVDHYHANGLSVANHYRKKLWIHENKITIIRRGRTMNSFFNDELLRCELRAQLGIKKDDIVLIQVARHEYQKAQDVVLKALAKLSIRNYVCVLAGREGNLSNTIKQEIEINGLQNNVKILGHRNDIPQLLAMADIFVFPSRFEGLPGALIEAEAAGLPIICSDIPNNREVAVENKNALFFPVNDVAKLAEMLDMLIHDIVKRKEMGAESLRIFQEQFELDKIHLQMKELIQSLIPSV